MIEELKKIQEIVDWYYGNSKTCQDIDILLTCRDRLAVHSFRLAQIASDIKMKYNLSYFMRKVSVARKIQELTKADLAYNRAEAEALVRNESAYKEEIENEGAAYKADILLKQVNKILDALSQRISHLKAEKGQNVGHSG